MKRPMAITGWCGLGATILCAFMFAGCDYQAPAIRYHQGDSAQVVPVPEDGAWQLYSEAGLTPSLYALTKGQRLGFERQNGLVIAVAGPHRDAYPDGTYYWRLR